VNTDKKLKDRRTLCQTQRILFMIFIYHFFSLNKQHDLVGFNHSSEHSFHDSTNMDKHPPKPIY
jgi:hypothetical protein